MTDETLKRRWREAAQILLRTNRVEFLRQLEAAEAIATANLMTPADREVLLKRRSPEVVN